MPEYSSLSRFSLVQLQNEQRQQRAHLKKLSEIQRHSCIDNSAPVRFPHLHQSFLKQLNEKRQEIGKDNEIKSKKLVNIMITKTKHPPSPNHPKSQVLRNQKLRLSQTNAEYHERITNVKSSYDAHEWEKAYQQHKEYLRIGKDNKVFTPLEIGINRRRTINMNSLMNSKRTTPSSSTINIIKRYDQNIRI
ncbi:unnamed protein product [Rotaria sp. Silwood2]|nr:unnamed protein product [Rotaria sp. Silwood2]CAF2633916.1 unnamed protein product [Rotaria sp. Silwood2]CAF2962089.1 unnamed protein product [Rotaria sp. Silwood2]CAF3035252.1 unnamed protein product [Rotaria sp. Silwood2]CAF3948140.1 unnamed protein product [Rotaria sp. Silwood2]